MRVFLNRWFARFARKERISVTSLCEAIGRASTGLIDADLGGGIIKQRVARPGQGRSGGYRAVIVFRIADRAFFIAGFAKNERDNLRADEIHAMKEAARELLSLPDAMLDVLKSRQELTEIDCDAEAL